jgi:hypothetical protein
MQDSKKASRLVSDMDALNVLLHNLELSSKIRPGCLQTAAEWLQTDVKASMWPQVSRRSRYFFD